MSTFLIIGLGNPGKKYEHTRHNVGFRILDLLAQSLELVMKQNKKLAAEFAETNIEGQKVILAKPTTFMNRSGEAVTALMRRFDVAVSNTWIVYDDADLPFGLLRIRLKGSSGGHKGLQSIIDTLGAEDFMRLRVGIGEAPEQMALEDWVLSRFSKEELQALDQILPRIAEKIVKSLKEGLASL
ncbi:aminoacyl-tRNA hydrolase [Patescibacteria group bacterium]|nr:aminoacyl-tRNA hydrolase [Patescibacteria group bacterium]